jgi:hypothetical protein
MNMSLLDQRKTETMLESWGAMHQDDLRGDEQQPQAPPTLGAHAKLPLPADGEMESPWWRSRHIFANLNPVNFGGNM